MLVVVVGKGDGGGGGAMVAYFIFCDMCESNDLRLGGWRQTVQL
jgi:hypothetical protein